MDIWIAEMVQTSMGSKF